MVLDGRCVARQLSLVIVGGDFVMVAGGRYETITYRGGGEGEENGGEPSEGPNGRNGALTDVLRPRVTSELAKEGIIHFLRPGTPGSPMCAFVILEYRVARMWRVAGVRGELLPSTA